MNPCLIVTVDTEEEGLWGGRYRRSGNTVENIRGVERFQELCDRYGVKPTYLVDAPVVEDDEAVALLREIQDDDRAEIGAHVHPWCNPPYEEEINGRNSYLCNLPEPLQRAKLTWITEKIEERFGRRPTSFRAGRYGLDITGARILHELGYLVDSSVIPFTDYSADGGPNFERAPHTPYFIDGDDLRCPNDSRFLLEVPVSVGFNRPNFARAQGIRRACRSRWLRPFHAEGILDRLGLVRRIKFSPEQSDARSMRQLVDAYAAQGAPAMVMMFHSSSLVAGQSPYVANDDELERFYGCLDQTFEYCQADREMVSSILSAFCRGLHRQDPAGVVSGPSSSGHSEPRSTKPQVVESGTNRGG
ncbi:MAG TPA: polysaccharide deacetylase family protein [Thermoguttaceae bacterium]|nr:polysaccharide deacetylase family protein [Thermoguttaceae bacterium]